MTLPTLLPRLESGEASDELDALLWGLYDPRPLERTGDGPAIWKRDPVDTIAFEGPPRFTTSLDAALALAERVLSGWQVGICVGAKATAVVIEPDKPGAGILDAWPRKWEAGGATPALALCAAIVKAKIGEVG